MGVATDIFEICFLHKSICCITHKNFVIFQKNIVLFHQKPRSYSFMEDFFYNLTLLHSERQKLHTILAFLSAIGLTILLISGVLPKHTVR